MASCAWRRLTAYALCICGYVSQIRPCRAEGRDRWVCFLSGFATDVADVIAQPGEQVPARCMAFAQFFALCRYCLHCRAISLGSSARGGGGQRQRGMPLSKCRRTPSRRARRDCLFTPLPVPHVLDSSCEASETWPIASERPHDDSADMDVRAPSILIGCRRAPPPRRYLCSLRRPVPDGAHASASFLEPPADETLSARQLESPRRLSRSA